MGSIARALAPPPRAGCAGPSRDGAPQAGGWCRERRDGGVAHGCGLRRGWGRRWWRLRCGRPVGLQSRGPARRPCCAPPPAPGAPAGLLRLGSTGRGVVRVQSALGQAPDGVFGPRTDRAVRVFQGRNGLLVDGIVGPHTWGTLFGPHGASYDPVTPKYQFKIQRASAVEEARVRPALAGNGPVAKIVLRTSPSAGGDGRSHR